MKYPDISHHHPVVDWELAKQNCAFLVSKATEGRTYIDPTLKSFVEGCEKHGIPYWLYTYLRYGNELEQAQFMVKTCKNIVGKHFVGYVLDVEENNLVSRVSKALDYINGLGYKTMVYTMYAQHSAYKEMVQKRPSHCAWWEARYGQNDGKYSSKYPPHDGVDLHQFTSNGTCLGISGRCDLNRIVQKGLAWYTTPLNGEIKPVEKKSIEVIAKEVLNGLWGNGDDRKARLKAEGYDYAEVQAKVNELLKEQETYYPRYTGQSMQVDVVFGKIGVPSKFIGNWSKRKPIATANGISDYRGKAGQNTELVSLAKKGKLKKA